MNIRPATEQDADAVAAIYGHHVQHGFGTFEEEPPTGAEICRRIAAVRALGLPYLVAKDDGRVAGFAYAASFRPRPAYRFTAESSVYVRPDLVGRGVGAALMGEIIAACEAMGLRQLVAVIGDSGNTASIGLHRSLGFVEIGVGKAFGRKHGRWVDIVLMQKPLNGGDSTEPTAAGLKLGES